MRCFTTIPALLIALVAALILGSCNNSNGHGAQTAFAAPPSQNIDLSLVGIHDPTSSEYNGDCISCHGDRLNEKSSDGVTPTAHSTMVLLHGEGNDHCIGCHSPRTDFLAYSAGQVRKQIDVESTLCTTCHGGRIPGLPRFYVR